MKLNKEIMLLQSLVDIPSPSGHEDEISEFVKKELLKFLPKSAVEIDYNKNVIARIYGKDKTKSVLFDAHIDTIGFIVMNVCDSGIITLGPLGYGDNQILTARHLTILTDNGPVNAVINRKHSHLITDEDEEKVDLMWEAEIDVGIRGREQVLKYINIGDPVVYKPYFEPLLGANIAGYGFDDKAGVFVVLDTIKKIVASKKQPPVNLVFTFTAQEETNSKIKPLITQLRPDLVISADVTFATDYGWGEWLDKQAGKCDLEEGPVICRGLEMHKPTYLLMEKLAKANKIPFQTQANADAYSITALMITEQGPRAMSLGIPLRNMHTPVETINMYDLMHASKLMKNFLLNRDLGKILE